MQWGGERRQKKDGGSDLRKGGRCTRAFPNGQRLRTKPMDPGKNLQDKRKKKKEEGRGKRRKEEKTPDSLAASEIIGDMETEENWPAIRSRMIGPKTPDPHNGARSARKKKNNDECCTVQGSRCIHRVQKNSQEKDAPDGGWGRGKERAQEQREENNIKQTKNTTSRVKPE